MTKEEINFVLEDNSYLENGTKQACVKIQDYLKNPYNLLNLLNLNLQ